MDGLFKGYTPIESDPTCNYVYYLFHKEDAEKIFEKRNIEAVEGKKNTYYDKASGNTFCGFEVDSKIMYDLHCFKPIVYDEQAKSVFGVR